MSTSRRGDPAEYRCLTISGRRSAAAVPPCVHGCSVTGDGILLAAAPLLAAQLTSDPVEVAAMSAAAHAAWIILGLPACALVDRWPRRPIMVVADLLRAVILALLVVLIRSGDINIAWLLLGVFLLGAGSCFFDPAAQATIPVLVSRERRALVRANGRLWSLDMLGRWLIGPPVGAALFGAAWTALLPVSAPVVKVRCLVFWGVLECAACT